MSPDPVKLIGLDKLLQPGPEKLAVPPELNEWAKQQAERELARRVEIIMDCIAGEPRVDGMSRMDVKDHARGFWTRHYHRLGGPAAFDDYWRSVQQAGLLEDHGWKPIKEKGE